MTTLTTADAIEVLRFIHNRRCRYSTPMLIACGRNTRTGYHVGVKYMSQGDHHSNYGFRGRLVCMWTRSGGLEGLPDNDEMGEFTAISIAAIDLVQRLVGVVAS